ncbi:hypothetical protein PG999_009702 [Apiospora kogelbergensis]|uniref:Uncharacterized protein n=1 Tax=Apiospora kogelbergensis TaxID=1337665 RepID=A0AAW0QTM9_9PEZI
MLTSSVILPLFGLVLPATAGPSDPDFYNTVANIYSGDGCAESSLVWADPIFGRGGHCQPLDRNNNTPDILSYMVTYNFPECHATLYADDNCLTEAFPAIIGACLQAPHGKPFVAAVVECPFSDP